MADSLDFVPTAPTPSRVLARRQELEQARNDAIRDTLNELIPAVGEQIRRGQEILPKLLDTVEDMMASGQFDQLKHVQPMLKMFVDENARLMDRMLPKTSRSEIKMDSKVTNQTTVVHTSLDELLARRQQHELDLIEGDLA